MERGKGKGVGNGGREGWRGKNEERQEWRRDREGSNEKGERGRKGKGVEEREK